MRIGFDATPAAVQRAGVGRYARELLRALFEIDQGSDYRLLCACDRDTASLLLDQLPPGAKRALRRLPVSDRVATGVWQRLKMPFNAECFLGEFDVFHGPDFVVPPTRAPSVVTLHDLSYLKSPELAERGLVEYLRRAVPRSIRRSTRVITVSAAMAVDAAEAYPWAREKIVAVPNGVNPPKGAMRRANSHVPTILCVGTIEPRKNHVTLLQAMEIVRLQIPQCRLVIAGRLGWQAEQTAQAIRLAEAKGNTCWVVAPTDAELELLYETATLAVQPSVYEGFGLPVLEAMARGVPVVASDIAAHREVGGTVVRYVNSRSATELAEALIELIDDSATLSEMATTGAQRSDLYSWSETARRTRRVYGDAALERA